MPTTALPAILVRSEESIPSGPMNLDLMPFSRACLKNGAPWS